MFDDPDQLLGLTPDEVLDRICKLQSKEEKARALMVTSYLLATDRGAALAREVVAPTTPCRRYLFDLLEAEREEARKRVASLARKAKELAKTANKLAPPNLFEFN
jgi:hypothetical protein